MARYVHRHAADVGDLTRDVSRIVAAFAEDGHVISRGDAVAAWRDLSILYARRWLPVGDLESHTIRRSLDCFLEAT